MTAIPVAISRNALVLPLQSEPLVLPRLLHRGSVPSVTQQLAIRLCTACRSVAERPAGRRLAALHFAAERHSPDGLLLIFLRLRALRLSALRLLSCDCGLSLRFLLNFAGTWYVSLAWSSSDRFGFDAHSRHSDHSFSSQPFLALVVRCRHSDHSLSSQPFRLCLIAIQIFQSGV